MKKFFFLAVALATSMFAQAQNISFGFEDADKGNYHCQYALTPRPDGLGDWVNVHEGDEWTEQSEAAAHSGKYGLQVFNSEEGSANSWDRGFKLANLPIKENVPYRVSFWVKGPEGMEGKLSSWLSVGMENFDKSFTTAGGSNYGLDQITLNGDGEWQRVSFVTVYHGKEAIKTVIDGQSWVGNATFPEAFGGDGVQTYKEHFGGYIPETFFFIANMNSAGDYMLDDILIEENVAVAGVGFNGDVLKIDFGFPTNIASLAQANGGNLKLDPSCVTVMQNGEAVEIELLEGKADGYVYAFLPDGMYLDDDAEVSVSFTPAEDCPITYTDAQKLPGVEQGATVLGFQAEAAYFDGTIDAISSAWSEPEFVSAFPENESFELTNDDFKEVTLTFNKEVSLDYASIVISTKTNFGETKIDLTQKATVSEDGLTVIVPMPGDLADGEYTLMVEGIANIMGMEMQNPIKLTYALGLDNDMTEAEDIYLSDFNGDETDAVPQGWNTYNEAGYHLYGFNDDGSRMKYGYGANPGGGGTRLFDGFSGDFTKALYWGTRGTNEGYASFGELVQDYMDGDGNVDESLLPAGVAKEDISLYLTPRKYNVSFKMAAWKGEPKFDFTVEDLDGNVYAEFTGYTAKPNLNGNKGKVSGTLALEADFTIEKEGYYVMKFVAQEAQWQEFMLADVRLITMPSKAAYYKGLLRVAYEEAGALVEEAYLSDDYVGTTLNALDEEVQFAQSATFHSPSEVNAEIEKLKSLMDALYNRINNVDTYNNTIDEVKFALEELEGTKYAQVDVVAETAEVIAKYGNQAAKDLSDEELAEVAPILQAAAGKLSNVQAATELLTWGIYKGIQTADKLQVEDDSIYELWENVVSDDREVAAAVNEANKMQLYKLIVDGTWNASETVESTDVETGDPIQTQQYTYMTTVGARKMINTDDLATTAIADDEPFAGIELTGHIANPKMYRVNGNSNTTLPGWTIAANGEHAINIGWGGTAPDASNYVTDQFINYYGDGDYDMTQTISDLPVGIYAVVMATRTPLVDKTAEYERIFYYNAQDSLGNWDKYMYVATADTVKTPFLGLSSYYGSHSGEYNTVIRNIEVGEGATLTIGLNEHYVSGQAYKHEDNTAQSAWTGTTMADDAHLYFVAPLPGYDYAAALKQLETALEVVQPNTTVVDIYNVNGVRLAKAQKGINIMKMSNGKVVKVLVK